MAKVRLIKIASEINIGRDAIVSFLQNKGFDIENKPTAFLTPEMADMVYEKFKKELKLAEKQREKVEKMKEARKTAVAVSRAKTATKTEEKEPVRVEEPVKKVAPAKTKKRPAKKAAVSSLIEEISPEEAKKKPSQTKKAAKEMIEEVKPETKVSEKEEKPKETKIEATEEKPKREKKSRKRKKRKTIAEVKLDEKGAVDKKATKGLKIVGKIDLDAKKKTKEEVKTQPEERHPAPAKEKFRKKDKGAKKKFEIGADKVEKKKKKRKKSRIVIKEEDVQRAMRETLAGMEDSVLSGKKSKLKQKKKIQREEKEKKKLEEQKVEAKTLKLTEFVTTADLADLIGVGANDIILKCFELGLVVSINQRLDKDTITLIADDYGLDVEFVDEQTMQILELEEEDPPESLKPRPPIVTIMGHVDHGKTSLLDFIRKSNIVAGEKGSITQHIGAYSVEVEKGKSITFLDTPGHQAFTAMRARGAMVTDIVVLVVAADDSVMPQTIEAISHAQAANVPIIVAINKIDKDDANPERIKQQLADLNVLVEEWGGKTQSVEISAKKGINVDLLLEKILLEAELLDLKANPDRKALGTIVEAKMEKGFGAVATVIVQRGTLRIGDSFVSGVYWGKVRRMLDERSNDLKEAGPSTPVKVIGFNGLPEAGDLFVGVESEAKAKQIATDRNILKRQQEIKKSKHITLDMLSQQIREGEINKLNLIIKADVAGSLEALSDSLEKLSTDEVKVNIIHKGVGNINESDVMLAMASGAVIAGFHVKPLGVARKMAENNKIDIRLYDIIYDCIEEVKLSLEGLLTPDTKEVVTADVEVRKVYKISKVGTVAGCYVLNGKVSRNDKARLLRDGLPVYDGMLESLKRNKDDVKEVDSGYECGIMLHNFNDIKVGDIIQTYKLTEVQKRLQ